MSGTADVELQRKVEEYQARERIYLAGLLEQDAEMNRLKRTTSDILGAYGDVSRAAIRGALFDPAVNMEVMLLRKKTREKDRQISELTDALDANHFDQKLPAGQALMRKCKRLLEENGQLGEQIREERVADLHAAFQADQALNAQLQQRCREAADFCKELVQENEQLQGTASRVAAKLQEARAEHDALRQERNELKLKRRRERDQAKAVMAAAETPVLLSPQASTVPVAPQTTPPPAVRAPIVEPEGPAPGTEPSLSGSLKASTDHKEKKAKRRKSDKHLVAPGAPRDESTTGSTATAAASEILHASVPGAV
uniref:Uncharacterized protein n=1 Tax=Noctiluca scintillans TaxID=2966 RepID=A0A7S0ZU28_NOCSC